jgi:hypothetical protein
MRMSVLVTLVMMSIPAPANAQAPSTPDKPPDKPIVWLGVQRGGPQQTAGDFTWMRPFGKAESDDNLKRQKAIVVQGTGVLRLPWNWPVFCMPPGSGW